MWPREHVTRLVVRTIGVPTVQDIVSHHPDLLSPRGVGTDVVAVVVMVGGAEFLLCRDLYRVWGSLCCKQRADLCPSWSNPVGQLVRLDVIRRRLAGRVLEPRVCSVRNQCFHLHDRTPKLGKYFDQQNSTSQKQLRICKQAANFK